MHMRQGLLTVRIVGPSLVVWKTLEHDIEKDDKVRNSQSGKREVIHKDQS